MAVVEGARRAESLTGVARHFFSTEAARPVIPPRGVASGESIVVLFDDQLIVAEALRRVLAQEPTFRFIHFQTAEGAIEAVVQSSATVVLQDLVMPDTDGFDLLARLKGHPETRDVPVMVLSGKESPEDRARAFRAGADDFVIKIPDAVELLQRVRALAKMRRLELELAEAKGTIMKLSAGRQG